MAQYRFQVHFQDGSSGASGFSYTRMSTPIAELTPKSVSITQSLNKVGSMSVTVNKSELADLWTKYPLVWKGSLTPVASSLWVLRDNQVIWAGYIWDIERQSNSHLATLQCEEMIGIYDRIHVTADFAGNYVSDAVGDLIETLLTLDGLQSAAMRIVDFSSVVPGASYLPSYTPFWYEYQKLKVGDLVRQLLSFAGVDWHQAIGKYDNSGLWYLGPGAPYFQSMQRTWGVFWGVYGFGPSSTYNGAAGRDWEAAAYANPIEYGTLTGPGSNPAPTVQYPWNRVAFEWGKGTRETVDQFKLTYSAKSTANVVRVGGYGSAGLQLYQRYALDNQPRLYLPRLHEAWDDPMLTTQTLVDNRTRSIISNTGLPQLYLTAQVRQPSPLASYETIKLGDRVRCTIKDEGFTWTGKLRIYNITLQLDDRGNEWMMVDLAPDTSAYQ